MKRAFLILIFVNVVKRIWKNYLEVGNFKFAGLSVYLTENCITINKEKNETV